ncbi:MAG: aminotransferase class III-fold pyridoxal phosphate-dependent enzyme [Gammaproteobacteria bacterium]|nr:aminotransferase class III-fold pyridoxal phosphate-dependent enzyme [Gammaproteobacteria bacterium]MDH3433597.1 aminotransferase class III-fold pyridoxal phosphate-dependent enzyme [Gammaproteobacteria bacterium]
MTADTAELLKRRKQLMGSAYRLFYDRPLHLVRGEGVWLFDADGNKYLDMYNNVPHVGHCHPRVVEAIFEQARTLNTHTRYLHENVVNLAERLTAKLPDELDTAMFCCTGSEANELALRIARTCTGGTGIIVTDYAYHGNTQAIYEISTDSIPADEVPDYVVTVPAPDTYRGLYSADNAGELCAAHIHSALELLEHRGIKPAAFVIDTIISSSGVVAPPPDYLRTAAEIMRGAGALFVADEVQPGFGRTGENFWGFEADSFTPDIVTMGKPMGNGHPLSAVVTRSELVDEFARHARYFNTFGGNPVSCAAGLAVLDVIEDDRLQQNALQVGQHIVDALRRLAKKHSCIGDVRGTGLFLALELVLDRHARTPATELVARVVNDMRDRGVLTGSIGPHGNILKLRPPLVLSIEDADYMLRALDDTLDSLG